jgi:hypothetical protein
MKSGLLDYVGISLLMVFAFHGAATSQLPFARVVAVGVDCRWAWYVDG